MNDTVLYTIDSLTSCVLMLAIIASTFSVVVLSGLKESARDLERPSLAEEGRDLDSPLNDFLFGVPRSLALSGEKRLALRGRILCCPAERES